MDKQIKAAYVKEVKFQMKMLQNLKRWLSYALILSSIALTLILFGDYLNQAIKTIGCVLMFLSLGAGLLLGWTIKKGSRNLSLLLEKNSFDS